jgi:hypothetical protein
MTRRSFMAALAAAFGFQRKNTMAYPYSLGDASILPPEFPLVHVGPYEYGSSLFVVYPYSTNASGSWVATIRVWASADAGVTWAEADGANRPICATADYDCQVFREGNTLHVGYLDTGNQINIKPFDLTTGTWGTNISGGPTPLENGSDPVTPSARKFGLVRLSGGNYVAAYRANESVAASDYTRVYYATYNGTVWSSGTQVDTNNSGLARHSGFLGLALGASDRAHFVWFDLTWWSFLTRSLDSGGTLGDIQNTYSELLNTPYDNPVSPVLAYADACGNTVVAMAYGHYNLGTNSSTAPTSLRHAHLEFRSEANARLRRDSYLATTDGPADDISTADDPAMSLLYDDGTLYAFWPSKGRATGATYKLMHAANTGAGWGAPVELYDTGLGTTAKRITRVYARKIAAGVGVVLASTNASSDFAVPHYWQGSLSATAPAVCSGDTPAAATYSRGGSFS